MKPSKKLIKDLEELNKRYLELNPKKGLVSYLHNKKEAEVDKNNLIKSGKLIIDFYKDTFIPRYSKHKEPIFQDTSKLLHDLVYLASQDIKEKNYFALRVLLSPKGNRDSDPNLLESLILRAKNKNGKK